MNAPPAALLDARYRLGPVIARGGMSTVFRGTDTRLDRPVAVKVMDPRLAADPVFRARFEREARSAARIHHPAVVGVFDQGEDRTGAEPTVFLVMELVDPRHRQGEQLGDLGHGQGRDVFGQHGHLVHGQHPTVPGNPPPGTSVPSRTWTPRPPRCSTGGTGWAR